MRKILLFLLIFVLFRVALVQNIFMNSTALKEYFYKDCFVSKSCFGIPEGCILKKSCQVAATVSIHNDKYHFDIIAPPPAQYAAVGLSFDQKMGEDSVNYCTYFYKEMLSDVAVTIAGPKKGVRTFAASIDLLNTSRANDYIYCSVTRENVIEHGDNVFDLKNKKYYVLLAAGTVSPLVFKYERHNIAYGVVSIKKYLADVNPMSARSKSSYRLHGGLMMIAWFIIEPISVFIAKISKQVWKVKNLGETPISYRFHQLLMVFALTFHVAGLVFIFLELKGWTTKYALHATIGVISSFGYVFQLLFAFVNMQGICEIKCFHIIHQFIGHIIYFIALTAVFLSVEMTNTQLPDIFRWIVVGYGILYIIINGGLALIDAADKHDRSDEVTSDEGTIKTFIEIDGKIICMKKASFIVCVIIQFLYGGGIFYMVAFAPIYNLWHQ